MTALLEARGLSKVFRARDGKGTVKAVTDVSLTVMEGETRASWASRAAKIDAGRLLLRLIEPSAGHVLFRGEDLLAMDRTALRAARRNIQMVFQDPTPRSIRA